MTKRNRNKNPLSSARKSSSKSFYQDLWHKKSGLGYALFVQYYGQQPLGVVVVDDKKNEAVVTTAANKKEDTKEPPPAQPQKGMSRAAKRRRKKKGGSNHYESEQQEETTITTNNVDDDTKNAHSPPLLKELSNYPSYAHLQPFMEAMSKPLPLTFRLRNVENYDSDDIVEQLGRIKDQLQTSFEQWVTPVNDGDIYQSPTLHKSILRRTAPELHQFLVSCSEEGQIARQELGSMLPVMGLQQGKHLKKNARILDTCASPGSKTLQALEVVGQKGRVYANDVHPKRLETLQEAVQRSGMPMLDRLVFTQHDATVYPAFTSIQPHVVMTDVPCSGDGTIRKDAKTVLPGWTPATSRALHELQCRILKRALQLVRVGGVVSYSTCSLNPMENEAVVAAALDMEDGVELLPWPKIEGITLRPGVSDWKVLDYVHPDDDDGDDDDGWKEYASYQDAKDAKMKHCHATLWPPSGDVKNLHHCRRLLPQDQDTGGFFVALLRKTSEIAKK